MRRTLLCGLLIGSTFFACSSDPQPAALSASTSTQPKDTTQTQQVARIDDFGFKINDLKVEEHTIKRNESLYLILDKLDFSARRIYTISTRAKKILDLSSMRPGQRYRTYFASDSATHPSQMIWQKNKMDYVVFDWQQDSLEIYKAARPMHTHRAVATGTIKNSLYQTISNEGGSPLLAHKMAKIFAWQIDFFSLRSGDSYKALYEKRYVDDTFYGVGDIIAARFKHRGELFTAYYFSRGEMEGYFNEEGESVQRALLKAPFKFDQRISSPFDNNRMHPILNRRIPHTGVDYAAPYGTPILATGHGVVLRAGYYGGAGNMVEIKHNGTYSTEYMHMKGFADGIHPGATVDQGEVIGYVGNTGRSTGPHLHYQVNRNDHPINPLTMELPSSRSIPDSLMDEFAEVRDAYKRQLEKRQPQKHQKQNNPVMTAL